MKDRIQTEQDIISAVDRIIRDKGFKALGINAIAKEAGVSKVLIYRYFENFNGLMRRWTESTSYWNERLQNIDLAQSPCDLVEGVLTGYTKSLREDAVRRELLRWLLAEESETGRLVMEKTERSGSELTKLYKDHASGEGSSDIDALFALLSAGISYLALMEDRAQLFNGVDIRSDRGWERINGVVRDILKSLL